MDCAKACGGLPRRAGSQRERRILFVVMFISYYKRRYIVARSRGRHTTFADAAEFAIPGTRCWNKHATLAATMNESASNRAVTAFMGSSSWTSAGLPAALLQPW